MPKRSPSHLYPPRRGRVRTKSIRVRGVGPHPPIPLPLSGLRLYREVCPPRRLLHPSPRRLWA